jgi:hypothetical protein
MHVRKEALPVGSFTVRVELQDAGPADYDSLNQAMESYGFTRTLTLIGVDYKLPTGEYVIAGNFTRQTAMSKAKSAAETVRPLFRVLLTESNGRLAYGLDGA